jgi:hypothetical protein
LGTANLGNRLQQTFAEFDRMDVAVGYFNLRGWRTFDELVRNKTAQDGVLPTVRILIGMVASTDQDVTLVELQRALDGTEAPDADSTIARSTSSSLTMGSIVSVLV